MSPKHQKIIRRDLSKTLKFTSSASLSTSQGELNMPIVLHRRKDIYHSLSIFNFLWLLFSKGYFGGSTTLQNSFTYYNFMVQLFLKISSILLQSVGSSLCCRLRSDIHILFLNRKILGVPLFANKSRLSE